MKNGFIQRDYFGLVLWVRRKMLMSLAVLDNEKIWPGIRGITPVMKKIPVEYHSTKDSFTIKKIK